MYCIAQQALLLLYKIMFIGQVMFQTLGRLNIHIYIHSFILQPDLTFSSLKALVQGRTVFVDQNHWWSNSVLVIILRGIPRFFLIFRRIEHLRLGGIWRFPGFAGLIAAFRAKLEIIIAHIHLVFHGGAVQQRKLFYCLSFDCSENNHRVGPSKNELFFYLRNPDWKAIIRLECNPSLDKPDDAKFEVLQDNTTTYVSISKQIFLLLISVL